MADNSRTIHNQEQLMQLLCSILIEVHAVLCSFYVKAWSPSKYVSNLDQNVCLLKFKKKSICIPRKGNLGDMEVNVNLQCFTVL